MDVVDAYTYTYAHASMSVTTINEERQLWI